MPEMPDRRFLIRQHCLPLLPEGARVWTSMHRGPFIGGRYNVAYYPEGGVVRLVLGEDLLVDVSAPAKADNVDTRWDILGWVLSTIVLDACGAELDEDGDLWIYRGPGIGEALIIRPRRAAAVVNGLVLDPWPDLGGLPESEAARVIVCAYAEAQAWASR